MRVSCKRVRSTLSSPLIQPRSDSDPGNGLNGSHLPKNDLLLFQKRLK